MLIPYSGELNGLYVTDTHLVYRWDNDSCKVLFSMTRHGNAMSCHFYSDKIGLRKLREAFEDATNFIKKNFKWCEMILANIALKSVERLVKKLLFVHVANSNESRVYMKVL